MWVSFAIASRIFRQLSNDHRTIGMILGVPILMTLIFGYAFTGETYHNPIVVVNVDQGDSTVEQFFNLNSTIGDLILNQLKTDDRVDVVLEVSNLQDAKALVNNRSVDGLIFLPENLTKTFNPLVDVNASIIVFTDPSEPAIGGSIFAALFNSLNDVSSEIGLKSSLSIDHTYAFEGKEISGLNIALPGIIGYISLFLIILLTVILIVREDMEGTKARFLSSPINRWQIMVGYMLGMMIFAVLISTVVLGVAIFIFNAQITGDLVLTYAFTLYFALGSVMLALFLARIARNEFQAVQLAVVVAIPSMALSGFMVPIHTLPDWLGIFSNVIPLTYAIEGLKSIMLRGLEIDGIMFEIGALTIYSIVAFVGAVFASKDTVA